jgi:hypothetical protein
MYTDFAINENEPLNFVTIAYKMSYYQETAHIFYDNQRNRYIIALKNSKSMFIRPEDFEKGKTSININGALWKFTNFEFPNVNLE